MGVHEITTIVSAFISIAAVVVLVLALRRKGK